MSAGRGFSVATWISPSADRSQRFPVGQKLITIPLILVFAEILFTATGKSFRFSSNAEAQESLTPRSLWEFFLPRDRISPSLTTWASGRDTTLTPSIHSQLA